MFKKISHMFTSFKDGSDYDDDYDEDYEDELEEERLESSRSRQLRRNDYDDDYDEEDEDEEPSFFEKKKKTAAPKDNRKVIPIKKSGRAGTEVCGLMRLKTFVISCLPALLLPSTSKHLIR